jgi:hypothetical protein
MQPLTKEEGMRQRSLDGESLVRAAEELIKPNSRLTSFERLEIYNRQYWFRVLSCFAEDFPGLRAIVGAKKFEALSRAYLLDCPSVSFTLRNLGSRLEAWLREHPQYAAGVEHLALDMVRLGWAHIEAFDELRLAALTTEDIQAEGLQLRIKLQPYVRLLELAYPVDDLLIEVRRYEGGDGTTVNAARLGHFRRRMRTRVLPQPEDIYLAVHRLEDSIYYKRLDPDAFRMLRALESGQTLEEAIDAAFADSQMAEQERIESLQNWFANWSELGWFSRI